MSWHIVGNGPNTGHAIENNNPLANQQHIVFNHGYPQWLNSCRISNQRLAGGNNALSVSGTLPFTGFAQALNLQHQQLQVALNAVPSSGLCCLMVFALAGIPATVSGMTLLPSLARTGGLQVRQPMASYFHNWLAERRLLMPYIATLDWPQFYLTPLPAANGAATKHTAANPYDQLKQLTQLDKQAGMAVIRVLADLAPANWLNHTNSDSVNAMAPLFYLSRTETQSPNWWLFDDVASQLMARVQYQLAWAQQQYLLAQV
ncbi:hypothetical protein [Rheinheimera sp. UJ63]|uniref:hypothetical protein n=1 Tax=Rheinheimera sp. UJ63 TaxID=2910157 RepID=UPI001F289683|nr:hypothetical protein [Rheinheimera sp. UJ63]MCF4009996.1 hypothetical protein [Rheinheimera sp. UJ63]